MQLSAKLSILIICFILINLIFFIPTTFTHTHTHDPRLPPTTHDPRQLVILSIDAFSMTPKTDTFENALVRGPYMQLQVYWKSKT